MAMGDLAFISLAPLDWNGIVVGQTTPCGGPNLNSGGEWRHTMHGVVIDFRKRNNMMYGLIGEEMGIPESILNLGVDPTYNPIATGAPDTPAARAAYKAGFDLSDGYSLEDVMLEHGYNMQEPNGWARKGWPSTEVSSGSLVRVADSRLQELIQ